jgi:hypothetical protein
VSAIAIGSNSEWADRTSRLSGKYRKYRKYRKYERRVMPTASAIWVMVSQIVAALTRTSGS